MSISIRREELFWPMVLEGNSPLQWDDKAAGRNGMKGGAGD